MPLKALLLALLGALEEQKRTEEVNRWVADRDLTWEEVFGE